MSELDTLLLTLTVLISGVAYTVALAIVKEPKMDESIKRALLEGALMLEEKLEENRIGEVETYCGICGNITWDMVEEQSYKASRALESIFSSWEHWSGSHEYPIADPHDMQCPMAYYRQNNKYVGAQLAQRLDLLKHVIGELENDLV